MFASFSFSFFQCRCTAWLKWFLSTAGWRRARLRAPIFRLTNASNIRLFLSQTFKNLLSRRKKTNKFELQTTKHWFITDFSFELAVKGNRKSRLSVVVICLSPCCCLRVHSVNNHSIIFSYDGKKEFKLKFHWAPSNPCRCWKSLLQASPKIGGTAFPSYRKAETFRYRAKLVPDSVHRGSPELK